MVKPDSLFEDVLYSPWPLNLTINYRELIFYFFLYYSNYFFSFQEFQNSSEEMLKNIQYRNTKMIKKSLS